MIQMNLPAKQKQTQTQKKRYGHQRGKGGGGLVTKSCLTLATPWTLAYEAPLSMGFSRKECQSGLPFPSSGYLPDPGIEPGSPAFQADSLRTEGSPRGGIKQEFGINIYTLLHMKQITNNDLLYSKGNYTQYFVITCKGRESEKKIYN